MPVKPKTVMDESVASSMYMLAYMDCPLGYRRTPQGPFDFGDDKTLCLHMKRVGYSISEDRPGCFGMFAGKRATPEGEIKFVVVIKDLMTFKPIGYEAFDSLQEMKQEWQLD